MTNTNSTINVRKQLEQQLEKATARYDALVVIAAAVERFRGKKLTAHLERYVADGLKIDKKNVHLYNEYGMRQLKIWGEHTAWPRYDDHLRVFLAYDSDAGCYDPAVFEERSGLAAVWKTVANLMAALNNDWPERLEAAKALRDETIAEAERLYKTVSEEHPCYINWEER